MDVRARDYKGYNLGLAGNYPMVVIKARGQGIVPKPLRGLYTTFEQAELSVDTYLNSLKKGARNGSKKTKSTNTG